MIPEHSAFKCSISWTGNVDDYDTFTRVHSIGFPNGQTLIGGAAHNTQDQRQTNPEELFAASVGTCMMMTILAVCSKSRVRITKYQDEPEALLELVERRYKVTKVTLKPVITIDGEIDRAKMDNLVQKAHSNCFITLSVNSQVEVVPTYVRV